MDISNRSLILLLVITVVLVGGAGLLSLKHARDEQNAPVADTNPPPPMVPQVVRTGGNEKFQTEGPFAVEVEKGTIAESAMLVCDMFKSERPYFEGGMGFEYIPQGNCQVMLSGTTTAYLPVYPGDRLICGNHGGKTECTGGYAQEHAATLSVASEGGGTVQVDGVDKGPAPATGLLIPMGKRRITVTLPDGHQMSWDLVLKAEEVVDVTFPDASSTAFSTGSAIPEPTGSHGTTTAPPPVAPPEGAPVAPPDGTAPPPVAPPPPGGAPPPPDGVPAPVAPPP